MAKTKEDVSLKKEIEIHGVTIKKMANGRYLEALELIKELPESFIKELMEGKTDIKLSDMFTVENIATLIGTLLTVAPSFTIRFLARLLDIEEEVLRDDLSPFETYEIVEKFWEINKLTDFFQRMKPVMTKMLGMTELIGFKEQLPSVSKLESVKKSS